MFGKFKNTLAVMTLAIALVASGFVGSVLADGHPIKERFIQLVGGIVTRSLPVATNSTHKEVHLTGDQRLLVYPGNPSSSWAISHNPLTGNVKATVSKAASSGNIHVAKTAVFTFNAAASAPTAVTVEAVIRDGATGAGTILFDGVMSLTAVAGETSSPLVLPNLYLHGTSNTAMTIEFGAAGGANTLESVTLIGETIPYVAD